MSSEPLVCARCALPHPLDERFCRRCGMPLTYAGADPREDVGAAHARARKIRPQYAEGELVRVAGGRNQAEAEFIQGMLLEEGIPSTLRRTRGFDVPDFLAAGPRDVLVPASGADAARDVLLEADVVRPAASDATPIARPGRVLAGLLAAVALVALLGWAGTELLPR